MKVRLMICMIIISGIVKGQTGADVLIADKHIHSKSGGVVFSGFPMHGEDYTDDVKAIMGQAIEKYGPEEWRLIVLTSELHGHLGVYAIIGAKMGLYAREILGAEQDEITIITHAGTKPPLSCMNDGLQASTGATLGHGLITVNQGDAYSPGADFSYNGKTIRVELKRNYHEKVVASLKETLSISGGLTDEYWLRVREIALNDWLDLDRNVIFETRESVRKERKD